jgi:flavin-dependent dehydrogenase
VDAGQRVGGTAVVDSGDVLIVGGGPAGAACASKLHAAGLDVVVADAAAFPRDKVCAGWITPQVIEELPFDADEYRRTNTFQPITGFRVGLIGGVGSAAVEYGRPVSFGIRRCEFDAYLLRRSGARLHLGARVSSIRRADGCWIVDERVRAPVIVGAGGHFCPVARLVNGAVAAAPLVAAQEVELPIAGTDAAACRVAPETPELYFCSDFGGYGWCFRKGDFLNVGFGRIGGTGLPRATAEFIEFLRGAGRIAMSTGAWRWRGHAYLLAAPAGRRVTADGLLLVGDSAGLAYPQSGEGIRPAIESGLMAADAILAAGGDYRQARLASYEGRIRERFGTPASERLLSRLVPSRLPAACGQWLLDRRWFVRAVVLNRWFLHARTPALAAS